MGTTNDDKKQGIDAYDYLKMAQRAQDVKEAVSYAKQALSLDPYCLDAELVIAQARSDDMEALKKNIERVISKGEDQLLQRKISMIEEAGRFYDIAETRPYMRVRKAYLELLLVQGRYRHAIREAEEMIWLNENDDMRVRYLLMALYSYFEEEESADILLEKYPEDTAFMLLPLIALYYKLENDKMMKRYLNRLQEKNPHVIEALEMFMEGAETEKMEAILSTSIYSSFSLEEVVLALTEEMFLYMPMNGFLDRLYDVLTE